VPQGRLEQREHVADKGARVHDVRQFRPQHRREMPCQLALLLHELLVVDRMRPGIVSGNDDSFGRAGQHEVLGDLGRQVLELAHARRYGRRDAVVSRQAQAEAVTVAKRVLDTLAEHLHRPDPRGSAESLLEVAVQL